ncbi:MAG: chromosome segregation protein SMC, partial [Chloroflexi bacterium]|nr:chromosome segregation protein SMC [Chloroflexota bacterium]
MLRIKRIVIQGFKTFARKTEFVFDPGVTAVVGPNGSGKSNVADAVRWCLGEQSFGLLRSKKTADVIFSGSDKRARMGMAQVSLTLDNSDNELLIDFAEVEISRRAYRDGENEYLLNGQRVRLQEITQLLAPSGLGKRTYAVIGQGLIDQVLSLKPEERRGLFEEAAGITGHQAKRATALRRLDATQENLGRVQDIVAELAPRLSSLKRQAERAKERAQVDADLKGLLHQWYGFRWHTTLEELTQARRQSEAAGRITSARRKRLEEVSVQIEASRRAQTALRESLNRQQSAAAERRRQAEELQRNLAVATERRSQLLTRRDETAREVAELQKEATFAAQRMRSLRAEVEAAQLDHSHRQADVERTQSHLRQRQQERAGLVDRLDSLRAEQRKLDERMADRRSRLQQIGEARTRLHDESASQREGLTEANAAVESAAALLSQVESDAAHSAQAAQTAQGAVAAGEGQIAALRSQLAQTEQALHEAERVADRLQTRFDLLERLRNEGAGYANGVRAVLQAAGRGQLAGVVGTVASQLSVPAHLDKAIETALGAAFQNLITERWDDTQAAIDFLKNSGQGRATFLPLDRLNLLPTIDAPAEPGILGNAAELVTYTPAVAQAAQQLLNRVWVAEDLPAVRRALDRQRGPTPTVVTLGGEIVRPGGAVTGGSDGRRQDDSILAREREYREMPDQMVATRQTAQRAQEQGEQARQALAAAQSRLAASRAQAETARQATSQAQQAQERARLQHAQAQERAAWQQKRSHQMDSERSRLDEQETTLAQELAAFVERESQLAVELQTAEAAAGAASVDDLLRQLADLRAVAAESQGHLRNRQAALDAIRRSSETLKSQVDSKSQRLAGLVQEMEKLDGETGEGSAAEARLTEQMAALQAEIAPAEAELAQLHSRQVQTESEERRLQQLLRQDESQSNAAQLKLQRTDDRLETLRGEIRQDFGLAEMEQSEDVAYQPPLPFDTIVAQLPAVTELAAGLEEEVRETRARLRRLSNVNP